MIEKKSNAPRWILSVCVLAAFLWFAFSMLSNAGSTADDEALKAVRDSVTRAVVSCYAFEGMYPANIEYLEENYNLVIDRKRYIVHYEKIADSIMPSISVFAFDDEEVDAE